MMLYHSFTVGEKEYKLRLLAKDSVAVEKKLGTSLMSVLVMDDIQDLPSIEVIVNILHASLQAYHHGITLDDTYGIYDDYIENGGAYTDLIAELVEVLKVSGFFRAPKAKKAEIPLNK